MENKNIKRVQNFLQKGVNIKAPASIEIGEEVNFDRISGENVIIHSGCKIFGKDTLIMPGVTLGARSPVTINNCQLGRNVELKGGYFENSTLLDSANMGDGAEVRKGCLLEEKANGAHTVGLKQTILLPFVTLGSIINFCDALMAGGTSRRNHSEVGSSYIHFNYTPNQDKATASLIGNVAEGVMLDQPPIFLGGQGGLVGPSQIGFNTVIAAGVVYRGDCPQGNKLIYGKGLKKEDKEFYPGLYWSLERRVLNSIEYIANIIALRQWYINVRSKFYKEGSMKRLLFEGALDKLDIVFNERIKRFNQLAKKMENSINLYKSVKGADASDILLKQKRELFDNRQKIEDCFNEMRSYSGDKIKKEELLQELRQSIITNNNDYLKSIKNLNENSKSAGRAWLSSIIKETKDSILKLLPSFT
jgi:UDP-N-acetylglucosamine/UDP-N-acetylgalactosamine diphosphorylase